MLLGCFEVTVPLGKCTKPALHCSHDGRNPIKPQECTLNQATPFALLYSSACGSREHPQTQGFSSLVPSPRYFPTSHDQPCAAKSGWKVVALRRLETSASEKRATFATRLPRGHRKAETLAHGAKSVKCVVFQSRRADVNTLSGIHKSSVPTTILAVKLHAATINDTAASSRSPSTRPR